MDPLKNETIENSTDYNKWENRSKVSQHSGVVPKTLIWWQHLFKVCEICMRIDHCRTTARRSSCTWMRIDFSYFKWALKTHAHQNSIGKSILVFAKEICPKIRANFWPSSARKWKWNCLILILCIRLFDFSTPQPLAALVKRKSTYFVVERPKESKLIGWIWQKNRKKYSVLLHCVANLFAVDFFSFSNEKLWYESEK